MVRVISVHNFQGQTVETIEQPTACTTAPPNYLLLAMTTNSIEVRSLKLRDEGVKVSSEENDNGILFAFPTVDEVVRMCHSINGDYIATIETKSSSTNGTKNVTSRRYPRAARVYLNWNGVATLQQSKMTSKGACLGAASECGMVQPMRARIAGRVTPPTNSARGEAGPCLEMIELECIIGREGGDEGGANMDDCGSGDNCPDLIGCCPITGNLCVTSNRTLTIFRFQIKTHDISRLKFVDFEISDLIFDLKFRPNYLDFRENFLVIMDKTNVSLVKLEFGDVMAKKNKKKIRENFLQDSNMTINYEKLENDDVILLSSITEENSLIRRNNAIINFEKNSKIMYSEKHQEKIKNLVNLSVVEDEEEFRCCLLRSCYFDGLDEGEKQNGGISDGGEVGENNWLRSKFKMAGMVFLIATQQEAFLYFFEDNDHDVSNTGCIAVYHFTAPIYDIVLEDYFMHALTETGLETYTLRIAHKLCSTLDKTAICPPITEPICLFGLRPFLGVEKILISESFLLLLANADVSPTHSVASNSSSNAAYWTLYALALPTAVSCFTDINTTAQVHQFSSPQTYRHLLNEGHMILKAARLSIKFTSSVTSSKDYVKLARIQRQNLDDVIQMLRTSCVLLGDHFLMSQNFEEFSLSPFYYNTACVKPDDVIKRAKKLQEQSNVQVTNGLVHYLKMVIMDKKDVEKKPYFTQYFSEELLKIFGNYARREIPEILLKSRAMREFSADKLILILENGKNLEETNEEDNLRKMALCVLYARKNDISQAENFLKDIGAENSLKIFEVYWEILFERNGKKFTDFSDVGVLMAVNFPEQFSNFLVDLLATYRKALNLGRVVKIFLEYLPSSGDQIAATLLLQTFLEKYFRRNFSKNTEDFSQRFFAEKSCPEALKLLTRTYLSQLQIFQLKHNENEEYSKVEEKEEESIIEKKELSEYVSVFPPEFRYNYLDKMEPFQVEITSRMLEKISGKFFEISNINNKEADEVLVKLQTILCSPVASHSLQTEIGAFLSLNTDLRGADALTSLILNRRDAIDFLTEKCPQCLPQFVKDRLDNPEDIRYLIGNLKGKIVEMRLNSEDSPVTFFYEKIFKAVLMGLATSTTPEELSKILKINNVEDPTSSMLYEIDNISEYVSVSREYTHAEQIKKLIRATGQQLLSTLNL